MTIGILAPSTTPRGANLLIKKIYSKSTKYTKKPANFSGLLTLINYNLAHMH